MNSEGSGDGDRTAEAPAPAAPAPRRRLPLIAFALAAAVAAGGSLYWRMRTQPVPGLPTPEPVAAETVAEPGAIDAAPSPAPEAEPVPEPLPEPATAAPPPPAPVEMPVMPVMPVVPPPSPAMAAETLQTLDALTARVAELELAVTALVDRPVPAGAAALGLIEVDGLLALASQRLALARDVDGAASALRVAITRLTGTETLALRDALADDLAALHAFRDVDVAALAAEIAACARAALRYPLAGLPPVAAETPAVAGGGWREVAGAIWHSLRSLVEIRDTAEAADPLLNPAHAALARQQLALELAAARVALLERDADGLRAALAPAIDELAREFDAGDAAVSAAHARLREIAEIDLAPPLPALTRSAEALAALRRREAAP